MMSTSARRSLLSGRDGWYLASTMLALLLQKAYAPCPAALCDCSRYSTSKTIRCDIRNLTDVPLELPADTKTLRLEHNRLTKLAAAVFSNLSQLEKLYLYNNRISVIEDGAFRGLSSLTRLDLTSNSINGVTNGTFVGAPKLQRLHLRNNRLSVLPRGAFSQAPLLSDLDLAVNALTEFPADVSEDLASLRELDLSQNPITLAPSFGQQLGALEDLRLNGITGHATGQISVPDSAFDGLVNLTTLELQENRLTEIPRAVQTLPNLKTIRLGDNFIRTVKEGHFYDPSLLQDLYLDSNSLVEIPTSGLSKLPLLVALLLDYNSIATVPARAFWRNTHLQELSLYSSGISSIDKDAFQGLQNLQVLSLISNNLTTIVGGVFDDINPSLQVFLGGNLLLCDCKLRAFGGWLKNNTSSSPQTLRCASPERLQGTEVVEVGPEEFACKPRLLADTTPTTSATQGTDVPLTCRIEADPIADIYWITSNHSLVYPDQPRSRFYFLTGGNGTLMVTNVSLTDQGSYTCVVKNFAGDVSSSVFLEVSVLSSLSPLAPTLAPHRGEQGLVYGVAVGVLVVVVVLILVAMIFVRRKRMPKPGIQNNPLPPVPDCDSELYAEIPCDTDANGYCTRINNVNLPASGKNNNFKEAEASVICDKEHIVELSNDRQRYSTTTKPLNPNADQHVVHTYLDPKGKNNKFQDQDVSAKCNKGHTIDLSNDMQRYSATTKPANPNADQHIVHTYLDPKGKNNHSQAEDVSSRCDKGNHELDLTTEPSGQAGYMTMKPLLHLESE